MSLTALYNERDVRLAQGDTAREEMLFCVYLSIHCLKRSVVGAFARTMHLPRTFKFFIWFALRL